MVFHDFLLKIHDIQYFIDDSSLEFTIVSIQGEIAHFMVVLLIIFACFTILAHINIGPYMNNWSAVRALALAVSFSLDDFHDIILFC